jgi:hypothetical protein
LVIASAWRLIADGSGSGHARRLLHIWAWYERVDLRLWPNRPIPGAPWGIFQVTLVEYGSKPFTLPDGTRVQRGDIVCRLHITNSILSRVASEGVWRAQAAMAEDLRALAASVASGEIAPNVRAIFGRTVQARAGARLGFVVRSRPRTVKAFLDRLYLQGLLALYCPQGVGRLSRGRTVNSWPDEVWMSSTELVRRYGAA